MTEFDYREGILHAEGLAMTELAAQYGTPCYVYSRAALERTFCEYRDALAGVDHLICYAMKANSNLAVLNLLARLGAGFDIVSAGELERVIAAGGDPSKVVFSGVAKGREEMRLALEVGIHCFNVESEPELEVLQEVAASMNTQAPVSLRVNPDVDAGTHPYISTGLRENKFGIGVAQAPAVYHRAAELANIRVSGMDCHIGSQLTELAPFTDALRRLLALVDQLANDGIHLDHLDMGGGLGVRYTDEAPPSVASYMAAIRDEVGDRPLQLIFEPGRSIAANAGILLTRVEYLKKTPDRNFALVDAGMNDMLRPALYQAEAEIVAVTPHTDLTRDLYDVAGPVCESADFLGKQRELALVQGDLLAMRGAGAYGFVMSSNYNSRPRAAEVIVDGRQSHLVRSRETFADIIRGEQTLPQD